MSLAPLKILQLVGSPTDADYCELSELYARASVAALAGKRFDFRFAHISPDGTWRFPDGLSANDIAAAKPVAFIDAVGQLSALNVDCALPQMFCYSGVSNYRALLDLLDIPYLGNRATQMSIAADKIQTKAIVAVAGVAVPSALTFRRGDAAHNYRGEFPVIVKPNNSDNSDGIALVGSQTKFPRAIDIAFGYSATVLVERYIEAGREVRCGIVERDGRLICLPLEEYRIDPAERPVRLRRNKLPRTDGGAMKLGAADPQESWIVDLEDPIVDAVHAAGISAYRALGLRQYGLFDFRIDPAGAPWFLEAGPYCSFAPDSVIVKMMAAHGSPLFEFFANSVADLLQIDLFDTFLNGA